MNRKLIHLIAVSFALLSFTSIRTHANRDHLEPCPVHCTSYDSAIFSALLNNTAPRLWMITFPGVGGQSAVIIDEIIEYEEIHQDDYEVKSRQISLKYVALKRKIRPQHPYRYDPNDHYSVDMSNDLERCEIPIDVDFSTTIESAWTSVLANTKYSDEAWGHSEAIAAYVFHCGRYYGYTEYSESDGLPMKLAELGEKLCLLAQSEEKDRDALKKQCLELAAAIKKTTNPNQRLEPTPDGAAHP